MSDEKPETTAAAAATTPAPGGTVTQIGIHDDGIPPAGEDIHLPGGTPIPLVIAVGITLTLIGTTVSWLWTIIGGITFIIALGLWIRDTRREVAHLPDDLSSPTTASHH